MLNPVILKKLVQDVPSNGEGREILREKGQFWTPDWVADAMIEWCLSNGNEIFDPAVGSGAFLRAAKRYAWKNGREVTLHGCELYAEELAKACAYGLSCDDIKNITIGDFIQQPVQRTYQGIIANPPYIRHHRLGTEYKSALRRMSIESLGQALDARTGLHVYFLIKALSLLSEHGRLAFVLPAGVCEGKFASTLWTWVSRNFRIDAVITFHADATPFPKVDTNPIIFFLSKAPPRKHLWWAQVKKPEGRSLQEWVAKGFRPLDNADMSACQRSVEEGVETGLSRPPMPQGMYEDSLPFGDIFKVIRGIATGCNEFFFLNSKQLTEYNLPPAAFLRAIGKTRDIHSAVVTSEHLAELDAKGQPTFLLFLNALTPEKLNKPLQAYLEYGKGLGLPERALIKQRSVWYHMEQRKPPAWLFAYLGRRNCRFVLNEAGIVPLTGFLCVYEKFPGALPKTALHSVLNHPATIANLALVAKSYGGGALKVEPRQLERLPIPLSALRENGLNPLDNVVA